MRTRDFSTPPDSGIGTSIGRTFSRTRWPIFLRCAASRTTTKSQPCELPGLEAQVAAWITFLSSSSGTGSGFSRRIARVVVRASIASTGVTSGSCDAVQPGRVLDEDLANLRLAGAAVAPPGPQVFQHVRIAPAAVGLVAGLPADLVADQDAVGVACFEQAHDRVDLFLVAREGAAGPDDLVVLLVPEVVVGH